jgi:hypothetical protein
MVTSIHEIAQKTPFQRQTSLALVSVYLRLTDKVPNDRTKDEITSHYSIGPSGKYTIVSSKEGIGIYS